MLRRDVAWQGMQLVHALQELSRQLNSLHRQQQQQDLTESMHDDPESAVASFSSSLASYGKPSHSQGFRSANLCKIWWSHSLGFLWQSVIDLLAGWSSVPFHSSIDAVCDEGLCNAGVRLYSNIHKVFRFGIFQPVAVAQVQNKMIVAS